MDVPKCTQLCILYAMNMHSIYSITIIVIVYKNQANYVKRKLLNAMEKSLTRHSPSEWPRGRDGKQPYYFSIQN